jgi:hypothetical protein
MRVVRTLWCCSAMLVRLGWRRARGKQQTLQSAPRAAGLIPCSHNFQPSMGNMLAPTTEVKTPCTAELGQACIPCTAELGQACIPCTAELGQAHGSAAAPPRPPLFHLKPFHPAHLR